MILLFGTNGNLSKQSKVTRSKHLNNKLSKSVTSNFSIISLSILSVRGLIAIIS